MRIDVSETIETDLVEAAWHTYLAAFEELRIKAVHRQVMYRHEFDEMNADRKVLKYLGWDDAGQLRAVASATKHLHAMPLISPEYFEHRWPKLYAERRIWYWWFAAVHPDARGTGIFEHLVAAMFGTAADDRGVVALDMCRRNADEVGLAAHMDSLLGRLSGSVRTERMDEESYWLFEFPAMA